MTPQERKLIDDLFEKLSRLENSPRDADASDAIAQGQRRAPNAAYALVQTVLVQDEALKRADARIQELEGGSQEPQRGGGFLDNMRDALFGGSQQPQQRGSVPSAGGRPQWNTDGATNPPDRYAPQQQPIGSGTGMQQPPQPQAGGRGGSFLGTAAAAAAGAVGGGLLMSSIQGMMGGGQKHGFGDSAGLGGDKAGSDKSDSPWSGGSNANNDLSREAGLGDVGSGGRGGNDDGGRSGLFDQASNESSHDDTDYSGGDDFDGGGDSDYA